MDVVVVVLALLVVIAALAVLAFAAFHRDRFRSSSLDDPWGLDDDDMTGVREPRRPKPSSGAAAAAVDVPDR